MREFHIYSNGEEFSKESIEKLETGLAEFVFSDVPLAVELVFVDEEEIKSLNAEQRGIDKVTDVLSFPTMDGILQKPLYKKEHFADVDEEGNLLIGSIVVCCQRAKEQAEEYGHSYERELNYLIVHGVMHCLGYDHIDEEDKKLMREKEELILQKIGITRE